MLVHRRLPLSIWSACPPTICIYSQVWRGALRELSVLPKNTTKVQRPELELSTFYYLLQFLFCFLCLLFSDRVRQAGKIKQTTRKVNGVTKLFLSCRLLLHTSRMRIYLASTARVLRHVCIIYLACNVRILRHQCKTYYAWNVCVLRHMWITYHACNVRLATGLPKKTKHARFEIFFYHLSGQSILRYRYLAMVIPNKHPWIVFRVCFVYSIEQNCWTRIFKY